MQVPAEFEIPHLMVWGVHLLNAEDKDNARNLSSHLSNLRNDAQRIIAAILLFDVCVKNDLNTLYGEWQFMACRDCCVSIYDFSRTLKTIKSLIGTIKPWMDKVDTKGLKNSETKFHEIFPFVHKMRTSVAHREFYSNPDKNMSFSGSIEIPGLNISNANQVTIHDLIAGTQFTATIDNAVVTIDMSTDTARSIINIVKDVYDSFCKIDGRSVRTFPPLRAS